MASKVGRGQEGSLVGLTRYLQGDCQNWANCLVGWTKPHISEFVSESNLHKSLQKCKWSLFTKYISPNIPLCPATFYGLEPEGITVSCHMPLELPRSSLGGNILISPASRCPCSLAFSRFVTVPYFLLITCYRVDWGLSQSPGHMSLVPTVSICYSGILGEGGVPGIWKISRDITLSPVEAKASNNK